MKKLLLPLLCLLTFFANAQVATNASLATLIADHNKVVASYKADTTAKGKMIRILQKTNDSLTTVAKSLPAIKKTGDSSAKVLNDMPSFDLKNVTVAGKIATIIVPVDMPSKTRIDSCSTAAKGLTQKFADKLKADTIIHKADDDMHNVITGRLSDLEFNSEELSSTVSNNHLLADDTQQQLDKLVALIKQLGLNLSTLK